jgi:hypothetical protein
MNRAAEPKGVQFFGAHRGTAIAPPREAQFGSPAWKPWAPPSVVGARLLLGDRVGAVAFRR